MNRHTVGIASLLLGLVVGWPALVAAAPNVVLIFADDLGYADIGPFGNTKVRTPNLDKMAAQGTKFTNFYATPVCSMSRACLMTGCYNARVSIPGVLFPNSMIGLHSDEVTVAEVLRSRGYATACIGKWHLGHHTAFLPTRQGFDRYFGIPYSNDMTIDPKHARFAADCVFREGQTLETAQRDTLRHKVPLMRGDEVIEYPVDQDTLTRRYTEEATAFIREQRDKPFFVYLPHAMVHVPLAASEAFRGKSSAGLLGDAIEELDWSVGRVLETLDELKLAENTLVIFTSDNGAASGSSAPWRGKKGTNYEGGVREPCIMRWPGVIPAGKTCDRIAGNIDVLPTLASIAGAELPAGRVLDGRDISSLLKTPDAPAVRNDHLYFAGERLQAIRIGQWKLFPSAPAAKNAAKNATKNAATKTGAKSGVKSGAKTGKNAAKDNASPAPAPTTDTKTPNAGGADEIGGGELYDLSADPYETKNVAAENPDVVKRLRAEFQRREQEIQQNKRPPGTL